MSMKIIMILIVVAATVQAEKSSSPFHVIEGLFNASGIDYLLKLANGVENQEFCGETQTSFSIYDYAVVAFMLIVSLGIGVFYGFFDKSAPAESQSSSDFMLGSGMTIFPVTLSLTTSFITAIELLGNPAEMYFNGGQYALIVIAMIMVIPFALKIFYPIYDDMKLTSCYEYLGVRFGKELQVFGGILYILQMCFYTSVSVLAPAIALSKTTGLDTRLAIVLIYIVCIFYSSQGGLKAVVIADTFQTCILVVSLLLVLVIGTYLQDGGISAIFQINYERGRLEMLNFDTNPTTRHTVWSVVIGGFFYWASLLCVNQATVQKAMSLRSLTKAKIALTLSVFGLATLFFINFYTGWMLFARYESCDPLKAGKIGGQDQLMPYFILDTFGHYTAFAGIFVAGVFSASLGTVAACLSSLSAVTLEDLCISGLNVKISPKQATRYAKWMNFGYGVLSFALIFLVEGRGILQATLTLNGLIGGIALGLFCLGIFFKRANLKGALYGGLVSTGLVVTLGIFALTYGTDDEYLELSTEGCSCLVNATLTEQIISPPTEDVWFANLYKISYMWYSMIGTLLTILFGLLASEIVQFFSDRSIRKLTASPQNAETENERKISAIVQIDSKTAAKFENTLKRAMATSNLPHLRIIDDDNKMIIVNEETVTVSSPFDSTKNASVIQIFLEKKEELEGIENPALDLSYDNCKKAEFVV